MGTDHLKDLGLDGRIIFKKIQKVGWGGMDCIDLACDRDWRRALLNAEINLRVP
jgi:hypothetical protein